MNKILQHLSLIIIEALFGNAPMEPSILVVEGEANYKANEFKKQECVFCIFLPLGFQLIYLRRWCCFLFLPLLSQITELKYWRSIKWIVPFPKRRFHLFFSFIKRMESFQMNQYYITKKLCLVNLIVNLPKSCQILLIKKRNDDYSTCSITYRRN